MDRPHLRAKLLFGALEAGAVVVLGLIVARSVLRPELAWDMWSYHLPFAARLHHLGGGADGFLLAPNVAALWEGYPLAMEWMQGLLWKVTGDLRWIGLTSSLPFVAWALHAARLLRASRAALVFGALAVPLIAIHTSIPYLDLPVAAFLAIGALAASRLLAEGRGKDPAAWCRRDTADAATVVATLALAGNSKYTAVVLALPLAGALVVRAGAVTSGRRRRRLVAVGLASGLLASATVLRNVAVHGNPLHPLGARLPGVTDRPDAVEVPSNSPDYLPSLGVAARPVYLLLSITELDWWVRGVAPEYDLGSTSGDRPARFGPARTGGWWGPYVVALTLFVLWARRRARRRGAEDPLADELGILLVLVVAVQALVPHGHSLRFWMAVPLLLVALAARRAARLGGSHRGVGAPVSFALAAVASLALLPTSAGIWPLPVRSYSPERFRVGVSDSRLEAAMARGDHFCLGTRHYPFQFKASAAMTGGTQVVEQVSKRGKCRTLPELDVPKGALHYWGLRQRPIPVP